MVIYRYLKGFGFGFLLLSWLFFSACKSIDANSKSTVNSASVMDNNLGKTTGVVLLDNVVNGCKPMIFVQKDSLFLIPMPDLEEKYVKQNLEVYFNYRLLRMKNPDGCAIGIPAQITDITVK